MIVELSAFGSQEVEDALDAFRDALTDFQNSQSAINTIRNQNVSADAGTAAYTARDAARTAVTEAFATLRTAIRGDLATL